jgi:hypothetical protein
LYQRDESYKKASQQAKKEAKIRIEIKYCYLLVFKEKKKFY